MGPEKDVIDIAAELGGITTPEDAVQLIEDQLDDTNLAKLKKIKNQDILVKVANAISICKPVRLKM